MKYYIWKKFRKYKEVKFQKKKNDKFIVFTKIIIIFNTLKLSINSVFI